MRGSSLIVVFCLISRIYGFNEYLDFVEEAIDEYMTCINAGTNSFEAGEKFKTYRDPETEKLYEFKYTESRETKKARKKGKDIELKENKSYPPLRSTNNNNANMDLRFMEKVKKVRSSTTEEKTSHAGTGAVSVGVSVYVVDVSVKTTVEGDQTDTVIRESENTTTQVWDRIQVTPPYTISNTIVKRFQKKMIREIVVQRTVSGYLPIFVKNPGRDLADPRVWKSCGISAPIKLSNRTYVVAYENFKTDDWVPSEDGGLVEEYPEDPQEYYQEYIRFKRNLQAMPRRKVSIKNFCRLLNPKNKVQAVVPDLDEDEGGIVEEDKLDDDDDKKDPTKEHNIDLNEFLDTNNGGQQQKKCKKKDKTKCGKPNRKGNKGKKGNKKNRKNRQ